MPLLINNIDLADKRVFIRVDYNIKIKNGEIIDDTRIKATLPTLEYALKSKAKIILASHLGRPHSTKEVMSGKREQYSLLPVAEHLSKLLDRDVIFPEDCAGDAVKKLASELRPEQIILLENLRLHAEEENNDPLFSEKLASLAEVYVNDAFGTVHRAHASTVGMVRYFKQKGMGFLIQKELEFLGGLFAAKKPFIAILGGAKVSDKIGVIENLMNHVNTFLIGGAMAYTFLKAKGIDVGNSLIEEAKIHQAEKILKRAEDKGVEICLPLDSVIAEKPEEGTSSRVADNSEKWGNWMGLDIGPKTIALFSEKIGKALTLFWNGPVGLFEIPPFNRGTSELIHVISNSSAVSVAGGGDLLAAIRMAERESRFTHLSTGGGASMEFLAGKPLPGIQALES